MNKKELVSLVQQQGNFATQKDAEGAVNAVIEAITEGLVKDGSVQLVGFGNFSVKTRAARDGINPKTKAPIKIEASKTVGFKAGTGLKDKVK